MQAVRFVNKSHVLNW